MSISHLSVKVGKVGKGTPHAEYIARLGKYAQRLEQDEKLEASESGNMPKWAQHDPTEFWKAADLYERKNGYVYREHQIALPRELNPEQRAELVREWVRQELGDRHAYTWAIHNKTALDGGEQPHVHLMYSERMNDGIERDPQQYFKRYNSKHPERGGAKKHSEQGTQAERKAALVALRGRWETLHNVHMEKSGQQEAKINMKSLAAQGIARTPAPKMLPSESAALHRAAALFRSKPRDLMRLFDRRSRSSERYTEAQERATRARAAVCDLTDTTQTMKADLQRWLDVHNARLAEHKKLDGKWFKSRDEKTRMAELAQAIGRTVETYPAHKVAYLEKLKELEAARTEQIQAQDELAQSRKLFEKYNRAFENPTKAEAIAVMNKLVELESQLHPLVREACEGMAEKAGMRGSLISMLYKIQIIEDMDLVGRSEAAFRAEREAAARPRRTAAAVEQGRGNGREADDYEMDR